MSFWSAIVLIVAIVTFAKMRGARFGVHEYHRDEAPVPDHDAAHVREMERELADLRERVRVLERIATDDRDTKRLAHEIESLRDR